MIGVYLPSKIVSGSRLKVFTPQIMTSRRIFGFDVARVFSILFIVAVYHVLGYAGVYGRNPLVRTFTYASLCIFTFISSFLLTTKYKFESKEEILAFYKKRVLRFYPLFFLASVSLYLLGVNSGLNTLKGLLGISPFFKPHPLTMWYCAMLISLYLLTPFLATGGWKKSLLKFLLIMCIMGTVDIAFDSVVPRTYWYYLVYYVGIIVGQYWGEGFLVFLKRYWIVFFLVFLLLAVLTLATRSNALKYVNSGVGMFALLSLYLRIGDVCENHMMLKKPILCISYSSMCMYLFHRQIFEVMLKFFHPSSALTIGLYLGSVGVILTIVLAYLIQRFYDLLLMRIQFKTN